MKLLARVFRVDIFRLLALLRPHAPHPGRRRFREMPPAARGARPPPRASPVGQASLLFSTPPAAH